MYRHSKETKSHYRLTHLLAGCEPEENSTVFRRKPLLGAPVTDRWTIRTVWGIKVSTECAASSSATTRKSAGLW